MSISKVDIENIAKLANLQILEDDEDFYVQDLTKIIKLIEQMENTDTAGVLPMSHPQDIELRLRCDIVTEPDQRTLLQKLAPNTRSGLYLVPKVID